MVKELVYYFVFARDYCLGLIAKCIVCQVEIIFRDIHSYSCWIQENKVKNKRSKLNSCQEQSAGPTSNLHIEGLLAITVKHKREIMLHKVLVATSKHIKSLGWFVADVSGVHFTNKSNLLAVHIFRTHST